MIVRLAGLPPIQQFHDALRGQLDSNRQRHGQLEVEIAQTRQKILKNQPPSVSLYNRQRMSYKVAMGSVIGTMVFGCLSAAIKNQTHHLNPAAFGATVLSLALTIAGVCGLTHYQGKMERCKELSDQLQQQLVEQTALDTHIRSLEKSSQLAHCAAPPPNASIKATERELHIGSLSIPVQQRTSPSTDGRAAHVGE